MDNHKLVNVNEDCTTQKIETLADTQTFGVTIQLWLTEGTSIQNHGNNPETFGEIETGNGHILFLNNSQISQSELGEQISAN